MLRYLPVILGMAAVTYVPRLVPMLLLKEIKLDPRARLFLQIIPYTSLSILIIRGILTSSPSEMPAAVVGIAVAGGLSYWKGNLVVSVFAGIIASLIVLNI
jgi:branched-subunit amino acid transport protein